MCFMRKKIETIRLFQQNWKQSSCYLSVNMVKDGKLTETSHIKCLGHFLALLCTK